MASGKTIDELVIEIKADTKQLKSELKQIEGKIRTTGIAGGAAFGSMAGGLSKVKGPAIAAAAAIAAIVIPIKAIASVGAGFEDLRDSLNQVFGSIQAGDEAFSKVLEFAQTTPFQIETVTKAFIGLKSAGVEPNMKMLQTFADTASSATDSLGTFEALVRVTQRSVSGGLSLVELNQIMDKGIDVFGGIERELGKSRKELTEFGQTAEGAKIIMDALVRALDKDFGGAMAAKMDNLSTKTSNMSIAFKGLADAIFTGGLGDRLKSLTDRLTAFADEAARSVRVASGQGTLGDLVQDKTGKIDKIPDQDQLLFAFELQTGIKKDLNDAKVALKKAQDESISDFDTFTESSDVILLKAELKQVNDLIERIRIRIAAAKKLREEGSKGSGSLSTLTDEDVDFMSTFEKLLGDSIPQLEKINAEMARVEAIRGKLGEDGQLIASDAEIDRILTMLGLVRDELGETGKATDAMALVLEQAVDGFANDFISALQEGENALVSFRNLAGDMIQQVIAEFLKMQVIKPLMNALFSAVGLPTIPMDNSAGGGTIQGGRATLVGERGPEIFVPNTGGTVMNNMNSKNAMGGGGTTVINQSINFATGIVPTVRAEVMQMMPQIADVTKAAVRISNAWWNF